jgi:predicted AAA+ superfamily ATPase
MHERNLYIKRITPLINTPVIKVITGMRRVGKSCLLKLIIERLRAGNVKTQQIVYINKESLEFDFIRNYQDLHAYVKKRFADVKGLKYLFVDEIQEIEKWEKAITSFFSDADIDIFITGSNAHLLSSEIATLISGRYIEIPVYALGFEEFLQFRGIEKPDVSKEFATFLKYGGFPAIHHFDLEEEVVYQYISALYDTILLKDVVKRNNVRNIHLLENVSRYLFDNIGNIFSAKRVADYIRSQRMSVGVETVQNYIAYLLSTFAIHKVSRYDIKGKRLLELHEKYYLGDIGMRHAILGFREGDISGLLENLVFLELKRRGYKVFIGQLGKQEIDFIAEKKNRKIYIQVAYLLATPETIEREFSVLLRINDNYPKYVLSMDTVFGNDVQGIQRINLIDFLLQKQFSPNSLTAAMTVSDLR